jgi:sugar lactone lactonase YvrE
MHCFKRDARMLAVLALFASGCAGTVRTTGFGYPPPPEKPRIVHVRSFTKPEDLQTGFVSRLWNALVPHDSSATITNPAGIALTPDEKRLYVASPARSRVIAIDRERGDFHVIGTQGAQPLVAPVGLGVDAEGRLYVSDKKANAVNVYDARGSFVRQFGKDVLVQPTGLAVDRRRQLVYVISDATTHLGKHVVQVFSQNGTLLRTLGGGRGGAAGLFNFPSALAVSPNGELYVSDMLNFRIQVFDADGNLVRMIGEQGSGAPGLFDKIHGVGFDSFHNLYVVDTMQGVQILNDQNQGLMTFAMGVAYAPMSIVIDSQNRIFVTDYDHAVHEFALVNTTAADCHEKPAPKTPPKDAPAPATAPTPASAPAPASAPTPANDAAAPKL